MSLDTKLKQLSSSGKREEKNNFNYKNQPSQKQQCKTCSNLSLTNNIAERLLIDSKPSQQIPFFDELFNMVSDQISNLKKALIEISHLQGSKIGISIENCVKLLHYLQNNQKIQTNVNQKLDNFFPDSVNSKCVECSFGEINLKEVTQMDPDAQFKQREKEIQYQLVEHYVFHKKQCQAIAIDYENRIVISACLDEIQIFILAKNQLIQYQLIKLNTQIVSFLKFMSESQDFISAEKNGNISIWKQITNQHQPFKWELLQTINCQENQIECITIDSNNKYLVYGSSNEGDSKLKFLKKLNQNWQFDFEFLISGKIQNICFNDSNDTLVAVSDNELSILLKIDHYWYKLQCIRKTKYGVQIFFINNSQFAIQSKNGNFLFIYEYYVNLLSKGELGKFKKIKVIELNHLQQFPMRYLKSEKIIVSRNSDSINLLKYTNDGCFKMCGKLIEAIKEGEIAEISHDGEYFISWDSQNLRFVFRQLYRIE